MEPPALWCSVLHLVVRPDASLWAEMKGTTRTSALSCHVDRFSTALSSWPSSPHHSALRFVVGPYTLFTRSRSALRVCRGLPCRRVDPPCRCVAANVGIKVSTLLWAALPLSSPPRSPSSRRSTLCRCGPRVIVQPSTLLLVPVRHGWAVCIAEPYASVDLGVGLPRRSCNSIVVWCQTSTLGYPRRCGQPCCGVRPPGVVVWCRTSTSGCPRRCGLPNRGVQPPSSSWVSGLRGVGLGRCCRCRAWALSWDWRRAGSRGVSDVREGGMDEHRPRLSS